ncbi:MAG: hypothetical protein ACK2TV_12610, partial [Anaerolineales bacterium]
LGQGTVPNLNQIRRRLLNQASADIRLDLVQILPGGGQINVIQPQPRQEQIDQEPIIEEQAETEADISELETSFEEDEPEVYPEETQEIVSEGLVTDEEEAIDHDHLEDEDIQGKDKVNETLNISETEEGSPLASVSPEESPISQETPVSNAIAEEQQEITLPKKKKIKISKEAIELRREQLRERGLSGLSTFFDWWRNIREKGSQIIRDFIVRWSPGGTGSLPRLSHGTLLFIAIAVPIIVVAIAVGVYLARGQTMQYEYYYDQAENSVQNAMAADDPSVKRDLWGEAISYLDQAESLRETDEITLLRDQAEKAIDVLDGAVRLTYRPAIIGSLYSEINITRIISYGPDLYLLDATGGRVIHALRGSQGYEVDADFRCEMGNYTEGSINALVDMASLPINNPYQAHLMTIDAQGNIAFCGPGQDPVVQTLPKLDNPVGEITRITYDSNYLYALNPSGGNILVYRSTDSQFVETPTFYFEGEDLADKPDLSQIVDLAVNGPDLYLLRSDGLLVDCISSGLSDNPVSCQNPVEYVDGRAGKEDQPVTMPVGDYRSILFTTPPDPSISILDASNIDIYRFSLRFRLYQRLRSELGDYEIDSPTATAFTVGIDRFAFIAFGNQVFYAYIE